MVPEAIVDLSGPQIVPDDVFGAPGMCAECGELCGAACGCSAAATACGCGACGACWRRFDRLPTVPSESIHEVLAYVATQPGIGCYRAFNLMMLSVFFTTVQLFALYVIIADVGGLASCGQHHDCRLGEYCHPLEYRCVDCSRLAVHDTGPALPLFTRFDVDHVCRAFPWYVDKFLQESTPEIPLGEAGQSPTPPLASPPEFPLPVPLPSFPFPSPPTPPATPASPLSLPLPSPPPASPQPPASPPQPPHSPPPTPFPPLPPPAPPPPLPSSPSSPPPFTPLLGAIAQSAAAARAIYAKIGLAGAEEAQKRLEHLVEHSSATGVATREGRSGGGGKARGGEAGGGSVGRGTGHKAAAEIAKEEARAARRDRREQHPEEGHPAHGDLRRRLREQLGRARAPDPASQPASADGEDAEKRMRSAGALDTGGGTGVGSSSAAASAQAGVASRRTGRRDADTAGEPVHGKASVNGLVHTKASVNGSVHTQASMHEPVHTTAATSELVHNQSSHRAAPSLHTTHASRFTSGSAHGSASGYVAGTRENGSASLPLVASLVRTLDEPDPEADPISIGINGTSGASGDAYHHHRQRGAVHAAAAARVGRTRPSDRSVGVARGELLTSTEDPVGAELPITEDPHAGAAALVQARKLPISLGALATETHGALQGAGLDAEDVSGGAVVGRQGIKDAYEALQMEASMARLGAQAVMEPLSQQEEAGIQILTQVMDRAQQSRIKAFHGLSTILEQRPVEYDRILPSKMVSLGYAVSGTTAVQRLCVATVHCIEEDLLPLRCDHIVQTVREWRPVGILYFFIGSFLLAGLLVVEADQAAFAWVLTRFRAVKLRSPLARWIVLSLGYSRWMVRAYLLPPLAVVAAVSSLLDDGVLEASQIVGVYLSITFILEIDNLFGALVLRPQDFELLEPTVAQMVRSGVRVQWLEHRLLIMFTVIMGGVLIAGIEFFMMAFRVGDHSEGAALCADLFDAHMEYGGILTFIIAIVGSIWERQAQRSDGAFRTVLDPYLGKWAPLKQLVCSCNPLGIAADIAYAFMLYFTHTVIVFCWRIYAVFFSQPIFAW